MTKPKIRHIALFSLDPPRLADFYTKVFDMELTLRSPKPQNPWCMVSDGHITLALLNRRLDNSATIGLNHFGFLVDSQEEMRQRIASYGGRAPVERPADKPYAEYRSCDPDGNLFDLSEHGFDVAEYSAEKKHKKFEDAGG